jgi:translation initiation factor IF-2
MKQGQGPTFSVLIQNGTLHKGDAFIAGTHAGKVRAMFDENKKRLKEVGPATPVTIIGCSDVPEAGEPFDVVENEKKAREISSERHDKQKEMEDKRLKRLSLDNLFDKIKEDEMDVLNVIVKGDVRGSVEAIHSSLLELGNEKVKVNIVHEGVGGINENDVSLAAASNAIILGFKVRPESIAKKTAKKDNIEIRLYDVIYKLLDDVKNSMSGLLESIIEEKVTGNAEVLEVFKVSKLGKVAGCKCIEGKIVYPAYAKLIRDNIVKYDSKLFSLRRFQDEVKEVFEGQECGIGLENYEDIKKGDIIECYVKIEKEQSL